MPIGDMANVDVRALRIVRFDACDGAIPSSDVVGAMSAAIDVLTATGADLRAALPPRIEEALAITRAYWARPESLSLRSWRPWGASKLSADDVERSLFEWDRLRRAFLGFMADVDVIVCPVAQTAAPAIGASGDGDYSHMLPFSLTEYPSVVVMAATSVDGLPIGLQVVARPWCEHVALATARAIERALGGWKHAQLIDTPHSN